MSFNAYLVPTSYEQPRPVNGEYPANVYKNYAEFDYCGLKVRAEISNGMMNADGVEGVVNIDGDRVEISWGRL